MNEHRVVAFLVGGKNVNRVVQFVSENIKQLSRFNLLITKTDDRELDSLINNEWVFTVPSLREGGSSEIAKRCLKDQVKAVVIFDAGSLVHAKHFPLEKLEELITTCWNSNTHICFDIGTTELVLNKLLGEKAIVDEPTRDMRHVLMCQLATFDQKPLASELTRRSQVTSWNHTQFQFWLEINTNNYFPMSDLLYLFMDGQKNVPSPSTEFVRYWARHAVLNNYIKLVACPLSVGINLLTLGKDVDIRRIWDCNTFQRDFLICHHLFMESSDLMKTLRVQYNLPPPSELQEECVV
eukprot:TRINITY_DN13421_c0_g1_i1.p1 TRINITY_DN13421_c0_g1~~TRINITY_DN13421_c0_g1_i1.p1  ORF type:complete len:329 (+),score=55.46 TRINITY_DN13421_c0_g1_i1:104-988(+)